MKIKKTEQKYEKPIVREEKTMSFPIDLVNEASNGDEGLLVGSVLLVMGVGKNIR